LRSSHRHLKGENPYPIGRRVPELKPRWTAPLFSDRRDPGSGGFNHPALQGVKISDSVIFARPPWGPVS